MTTINISTTRKNAIVTELQKHNIQPSDDAINAVIQILKDTPKGTVSSAVEAYASGNKAQANEAQKATGDLNQLLADYSNEMRRGIKKQVVKNALLGAIEDFKNGDFSDCLDDGIVEELNLAMNTEYKFIELADLSPKYLPSSNDTPQLLPSAIEVESTPTQE